MVRLRAGRFADAANTAEGIGETDAADRFVLAIRRRRLSDAAGVKEAFARGVVKETKSRDSTVWKQRLAFRQRRAEAEATLAAPPPKR